MAPIKVLRLIARGGFGRVEEVQITSRKRAARKVFDPQMPLSTEERDKLLLRFKREVNVQEQLPSHITLPVLRKDLKSQQPWYLMPLAEKNYRQQIAEDRVANKISLAPIADMLNALEELHSLGFVHRDIKPENVLLHDKKWKLADFGLVMPTDTTSSRFTSSTSGWGTQLYMAPEQFTSFRDVTPAADIYSVGCILHDLVTSGHRLPFQRLTCDGLLGPIIEKCTESDPLRRFSDVRKLRDTLLTALSQPVADLAETPASEWMEQLKDSTSWTLEQLEAFVKSLQRMDPKSDTTLGLYQLIDENALEIFFKLDPAVWAQLTELYFLWTNQDFGFEYCDVIVTRLRKIFDLGNAAQKAGAVMAAARLGSSHHRWYVMRHVLTMAGSNLEDIVAQRLSIEIEINDIHANFLACADSINMTAGSYHPAIAKVLLKHVKSK